MNPRISSQPRAPSTSAYRWALAAVLLILFVAIRCIHLTADSPTELPNHHEGWSELIEEGPAKAHEARNQALFGTWKTNPVDNYQFWRAQSPVWVYPLSWFFEAFGVGYAQLRAFSISTAAIAVIGLVWIAARRLRGWPVAVAGLLLSGNYYYIFYARVGLLEPTLNSFLVLSMLFLLLAFEMPLWLCAAQAALVLAFLTKQTALVLLPLFAIGMVWAVVRDRRRGGPPWRRALPFLTLALVIGGLVFYVSREAYWRTVVWNFGHMLLDDTQVRDVEISRMATGEVVARLFAWRRWRDGFFLLMPVAAPLALVALGRMAARLVTHRTLSEWDVLVALWFLSVLGSLQLTPLTDLRYSMVLVPPASLLAALGLDALLDYATRIRWVGARSAVVAALLIALLLTHGYWFIDWASRPTYVLTDTNEEIEARVGKRHAVVIGRWAMPLVFETPYESYYVKERFNVSREALKQLRITHLLVRHKGDGSGWFSRHDEAFWTFKKSFPQVAASAQTLATYSLWDGYRADLRALAPSEPP